MSRDPLKIVLAVAAVLLLAAGGSWLVDHVRQPSLRAGPRVRPGSVPVNARLVTLEVSGLTCANCASRVTTQLEATAGVRSCGVDPAAERAWVVCDRAVADTALVAAVVRAGSRAGGASEYAARVIPH
jgi:copper chaperone CopZ